MSFENYFETSLLEGKTTESVQGGSVCRQDSYPKKSLEITGVMRRVTLMRAALLLLQVLSGVVVKSCLKPQRAWLRADVERGTRASWFWPSQPVESLSCPLVHNTPWQPALPAALGESLHFNFMCCTSAVDGISSVCAV